MGVVAPCLGRQRTWVSLSRSTGLGCPAEARGGLRLTSATTPIDPALSVSGRFSELPCGAGRCACRAGGGAAGAGGGRAGRRLCAGPGPGRASRPACSYRSRARGCESPHRRAVGHGTSEAQRAAEADGNRTRRARVATTPSGFEVRGRHQRGKRFRGQSTTPPAPLRTRGLRRWKLFVGGSTYSIRDAARILKLSPERLRYWEKTGLVAPARAEDGRALYGFRDLVCVKTVLVLLENGVPLRRIRRSIEAIRERVPELDRPLEALRVWLQESAPLVL